MGIKSAKGDTCLVDFMNLLVIILIMGNLMILMASRRSHRLLVMRSVHKEQ